MMLNRRDFLQLTITGLAVASSMKAAMAMPPAVTAAEPLQDGYGAMALQHLIHGNKHIEQVNSLTLNSDEFFRLPTIDALREPQAFLDAVTRRHKVVAELERRGLLHILDMDHPQSPLVDSRNKACKPWVDALVA